jgi:signal transduction histidine kinase
VQAQPGHIDAALLRLLRELFEPLEATPAPRRADVSWVVADGSTLYVPVPSLKEAGRRTESALMLRFAHRGRRLFTAEDARLADRIVDQLRHMVAFDLAVEHGRSEERARIAQDLHDDIGARLLTMIYKSPNPEMEEYVRHTLQDLKTLTRGLAAREHRLSHAAAEWKRDLVQRLEIAHCDLEWNCTMDQDVELSVVQWSGLTRVLRELVNNTIAHARATQVEVSFQLLDDRIDLSVRDNGVGRNPASWAHGLGLSGVRKRVKQLGGVVEWREIATGGIECRVRIPNLMNRG